MTAVDEDDARVLVVRGEVDMESSPTFLEAIQQGLRQGGPQVVDLSGVSYMDSSGIAVLVQGLRAARKRGVEFRLRAPSKQVAGVLRLAQLLQLFTIDGGGAGGG
jgi:anti-sigma B factor antagonist